MRQALAKSDRKKLRQIVGTAGIASIDAHDLAIQQLAANTAQGLKGVDDRRHRGQDALEVRLRACEAFLHRPFRDRLRWLLRGR